MIADSLWSIIPFVMLIAGFVIIRNRKRAGVTGMKTALTPICLLLSACINYVAYVFQLMGIASWGISILLLVLAAYFTKHLPNVQT
ncbi:hypothetical protein ACW0KB_01210 [Virgibacillus salarius]